ncbi:MAG: tRNA (guanosine(37)-N1)-methyltransferase TrmD [Candidatus Absconditabacterales bacterium]
MLTFYIVTIFPELFDSWSHIALFGKAVDKKLVKLEYINPRQFTTDRHQTVDDKVYGGGEGLLMKAKPAIDAVNHAVAMIGDHPFQIIYPSPSTVYFEQAKAFELCTQQHIILICGRYEGIDHRFEQYCLDHYPKQFHKRSVGKYITYGGEVPCMLIMEAVTRLLPGGTHKPPVTESYYPQVGADTIENPHYTRPQEVYAYKIPDILLSGHHKNIDTWREDMMT